MKNEQFFLSQKGFYLLNIANKLKINILIIQKNTHDYFERENNQPGPLVSLYMENDFYGTIYHKLTDYFEVEGGVLLLDVSKFPFYHNLEPDSTPKDSSESSLNSTQDDGTITHNLIENLSALLVDPLIVDKRKTKKLIEEYFKVNSDISISYLKSFYDSITNNDEESTDEKFKLSCNKMHHINQVLLEINKFIHGMTDKLECKCKNQIDFVDINRIMFYKHQLTMTRIYDKYKTVYGIVEAIQDQSDIKGIGILEKERFKLPQIPIKIPIVKNEMKIGEIKSINRIICQNCKTRKVEEDFEVYCSGHYICTSCRLNVKGANFHKCPKCNREYGPIELHLLNNIKQRLNSNIT